MTIQTNNCVNVSSTNLRDVSALKNEIRDLVREKTL